MDNVINKGDFAEELKPKPSSIDQIIADSVAKHLDSLIMRDIKERGWNTQPIPKPPNPNVPDEPEEDEEDEPGEPNDETWYRKADGEMTSDVKEYLASYQEIGYKAAKILGDDVALGAFNPGFVFYVKVGNTLQLDYAHVLRLSKLYDFLDSYKSRRLE